MQINRIINAVIPNAVIPAQAGIQSPTRRRLQVWIPAFAGMTECGCASA